MNEKEFKYEVAFSFLAEDEGIAAQINDLIQDRVKTFLYSKKQEELAGTDGEETFNRVFGSEARIVFVLYRDGWGQTAWTRIEETAIRNRAFEEGYDFVIFAPVGDKVELPKWLPKNKIWVGLDRWGIEGAASIIEARIQEAGGKPRKETLEEHAARISRSIAVEKQKRAFLGSEGGVKSANSTFAELVKILTEIADKLSKNENEIQLDVETSAKKISIYCNGYTILVHWSLAFSNSLSSSALYVSLFEGVLSVSGRSFSFEKPVRLWDKEFSFDQTNAGHPAWLEVGGAKKVHTNDQLAKHVITTLLGKVHEEEMKKKN